MTLTELLLQYENISKFALPIALSIIVWQQARIKNLKAMNKDINPETYRGWVKDKMEIYKDKLENELQQKVIPLLNERSEKGRQYHLELLYFSIYIYEGYAKEKRDELFEKLIPVNFDTFRDEYKDYPDYDEAKSS